MQPKKRAMPITVSEEDIKSVLNQHSILQRQLAVVGAGIGRQNEADNLYQGDSVGSNNIVDQKSIQMRNSLGEGNGQGQEIEIQVGHENLNPQTGQSDMVGSNGNNLNPIIGNDTINQKNKNFINKFYDYRKLFFDKYPDLNGKVVVHHAIEQQVLKKHNKIAKFTEEEIHILENLRGIPNEFNSDIHLSKIRLEWNRFYREHPQPTREQFYKKVNDIDVKFGAMFNPQIKNGGAK